MGSCTLMQRIVSVSTILITIYFLISLDYRFAFTFLISVILGIEIWMECMAHGYALKQVLSKKAGGGNGKRI